MTYPNVNNYEWNNVVTTGSQYSAGTKSYDLTGSLTVGNTGYKWIVFKLSMANKSSHNVSGSIYNYYNVYSFLTGKGISSTTVQKIKDSTDTNMVGFVLQTVSSSVRVGNLGRNYKSTDLWYGKNSDLSYANMANGTNKASIWM